MIKLLRNFRLLIWGQALLAGIGLTTGCSLFRSEPPPDFTPVAYDSGSGSNSAPLSSAAPDRPEQYTFQIDDLVTVGFSGIDNPPPPHEERIKNDGNISLPYVGAVKAVGKTPGELQRDIRQLYVPRLYNTNLTITVKGQERFFFVQGFVRGPGRYAYSGKITVTKAISAAGDFNDFANKKKVRLTRSNGKKYTINCIKALNDPSLDLPVYPDDQIYVPKTIF
jgi:polysaccharide export outer membrane protein